MLKMDFLALVTLTDIKKCVDYIKEDFGIDVDFVKIGYEELYLLSSSAFLSSSVSFSNFAKALSSRLPKRSPIDVFPSIILGLYQLVERAGHTRRSRARVGR